MHKTARDEDFVPTFKVADKVDILSVFVSQYFAFIVIVPDSFPCLFCVFINLGDVITQLLHCPGSHFYISLRTVSAHASKRFCGRRALEIRYCCIFCEISHWAGPNQLFLLLCVKRTISVYSM